MPESRPIKPEQAEKWRLQREANRKPGGHIDQGVDTSKFTPLRLTSAALAESRANIARLYLHGKKIDEIARALNLTKTIVIRDLDYIRRVWMMSAIIDLDEAKSRELARLDELEATAWDAWQRSKTDKRSISRTTKDVPVRGGDDDTDYAQQVEKRYTRDQRTGNVLYLEMVMKCIERRCKILGLDAPERSEMAMALTSAQRTQVEFVNRVIGSPGAVRAAHQLIALSLPSDESALDAGRPGGDNERGSVEAGSTLAATVDALVRVSGGSDSWPDSGDATEARQE